MNGERVAQIMQSRLIASAIDPFDIRILTQVFESRFDERTLYRSAPAQHKKGRRATLIMASFCSPFCVSRQLLIQFGSQWHHSCLVELRVANHEQCTSQIDIVQGESQSLADAQSRAIEQQQDRAQRVRLKFAMSFRAGSSGGVEECAQFGP